MATWKSYLSSLESQGESIKLSPKQAAALRDACISPDIRIAKHLTKQFGNDMQIAANALTKMRKELDEQAQKLDDYISKQEAQKAEDELQRVLDLKKQRRHDWRIALVSAAVGAIFSFLCNNLHAIVLFFRELFH